MARETLAIEKTSAIIKSTNDMIVVSIVIHSRGKLGRSYLWLIVAFVHP